MSGGTPKEGSSAERQTGMGNPRHRQPRLCAHASIPTSATRPMAAQKTIDHIQVVACATAIIAEHGHSVDGGGVRAAPP